MNNHKIVLILAGISERVADIKTRAHAMKCLTAFSEAVGPGFVFDRVSAKFFLLRFQVSLLLGTIQRLNCNALLCC